MSPTAEAKTAPDTLFERILTDGAPPADNQWADSHRLDPADGGLRHKKVYDR